jgi:hypothetical protein
LFGFRPVEKYQLIHSVNHLIEHLDELHNQKG